ncbi:MAG TPA: extracellular solute-binding protein [Ktedonobacteraceae bacterium]|nr:extracellular solute-binding protein [Ktedonobacteraceae bacterium]
MQPFSFPQWMRCLALRFAIVSMALVIMAPLAACGGSGSTTSSTTSSGPVNLTFWNWIPGIDKVVARFNQTHPNIHVTAQNVGSGPTEYDKLYTAIKANNEPDLGMIEYQLLPTFESTGALVDFSP